MAQHIADSQKIPALLLFRSDPRAAEYVPKSGVPLTGQQHVQGVMEVVVPLGGVVVVC